MIFCLGFSLCIWDSSIYLYAHIKCHNIEIAEFVIIIWQYKSAYIVPLLALFAIANKIKIIIIM